VFLACTSTTAPPSWGGAVPLSCHYGFAIRVASGAVGGVEVFGEGLVEFGDRCP